MKFQYQLKILSNLFIYNSLQKIISLLTNQFPENPTRMAFYKGAASEAGRAEKLLKKREKEQQELEIRKKKIEKDLNVSIENKFFTHYDAVEQQIKSSTIGLVTLDEMKAKQENIVKEREKKLALKEKEKDKEKLKGTFDSLDLISNRYS